MRVIRSLYTNVNNHIGKYKVIDKIDKGVRQELINLKQNKITIPLIINGKEKIKNLQNQFCPYDKTIIASYSHADTFDIKEAIKSSNNAKKVWSKFSFQQKADIFIKAANLVETKYRNKLLASTILGQGKSIYEAEIDAISELSDFLRFNVKYLYELNNEKLISKENEKNTLHWSSLSGFVTSISPFNFTAIGGNLATAPILMGNTVLWKPSDYSILSNYFIFKIFEEAGLPKNVLQFIPSNPNIFVNEIIKSPDLGGIAFTGSDEVFKSLQKKIYGNIENYKSIPRIIGETGGNNYHFIFPDMKDYLSKITDLTISGAYGYSGQKCSATKRLYIPEEFEDDFISLFKSKIKNYTITNPEEDYVFSSAVIHETSFNQASKFLLNNKKKIIYSQDSDCRKGNYIYPSLLKENNLNSDIWKKEIFGPILIVNFYPESKLKETIKACTLNTNSHLTGAVFYLDNKYNKLFEKYFKNNVGNLYINDKSTGSVVGQQPFGGFGSSGTNDKAGSKYFLTRFGNCIVTKKKYIK